MLDLYASCSHPLDNEPVPDTVATPSDSARPAETTGPAACRHRVGLGQRRTGGSAHLRSTGRRRTSRPSRSGAWTGVIPWHLNYTPGSKKTFSSPVRRVAACRSRGVTFSAAVSPTDRGRDDNSAALMVKAGPAPRLPTYSSIPLRSCRRADGPKSLRLAGAELGGREDALRKIVARPNPSAGPAAAAGHVVSVRVLHLRGNAARGDRPVHRPLAHFTRFVLTPLPAD